MDYDYTLHAHRFAVWTAARAVNRNFINTQCVSDAIEKTALPIKFEKLAGYTTLDHAAFDAFHREAVNALVSYLQKQLGESAQKATYGRASKIVAMYIKTRYVIPNPTCQISKVAHPPIDAILLKNLSIEYKSLKVNNTKWTQLSESSYFELVDKLRQHIQFDYFWELEQYWLPG
jgi:hypothetical protein